MTEASTLPDQIISGAYLIKIPGTEVSLTHHNAALPNTNLDMNMCKIHAKFQKLIQMKKM